MQRTTCYGRLGLGDEAGALWEQILGSIPATARRDRGVYLARHATAAAHSGRPDQAEETVRSVVEIAVETGSARIRGELGAFRRAMRPWQDAPVGQAVREVLARVSEGS